MEENNTQEESLGQIKHTPRTRLTITEAVYYQLPNDNPVCIDSAYALFSNSDEQVYQRDMKLTEAWQRLDSGWIENASLVCLKNAPIGISELTVDSSNEQGMIEVALLFHTPIVEPQDNKPTTRTMYSPAKPKEPIQINTGVIPLPFSILKRGESIRITPPDLTLIMVRCVSGTAKLKVSIFPA